jgi:hypothetical protein
MSVLARFARLATSMLLLMLAACTVTHGSNSKRPGKGEGNGEGAGEQAG